MDCNCKKVKYGSQSAALADIKRIKKSSDRDKIPTRAYKCSGGVWHLTSRPDIKEIIDELKASQDDNAKLLQELEQFRNKEKREMRKHLRADEMVQSYKALKNKINTKYRKLQAEHKELIGRYANLQQKYQNK